MQEGEKQKPNIFFSAADIALTLMFNLTRLLAYTMPPALTYHLLRGIGSLLFYMRPGMRRRLVAKIGEAMPQVTDPRELERIGRDACGAFLLPMFDFFTLERHGDRFMRELTVEGMENLEKAESLGKGVLLTSVHAGWIAVIHAVAYRLGKVYTPIAFNPKNTRLPRYVGSMEIQGFFLGSDPEAPVFWVGRDTVKKVHEHLRKGKRVGLTFDVDGNSIVEFFGRPAALASGLAHFSYDTGAPIVPFVLLRGRKIFDNRLIFYPPVFPDSEAERSGELSRILREVVAAGESMITEAPGQWMSWFGLWQWWANAEKLKASKAGK